jgi:osmotically-inducible protein OsmY
VLELLTSCEMYPLEFSTGFPESPDLVLLIEQALEKCEETRGAAVDILARGGTIVLMGHVSTESVKVAAERVTRAVIGVAEVENYLEIEK